jgi:hypothetical protein
MSTQCQKCGDHYALRDGCDPTSFCDTCAQTVISNLESIVPEPPNAITYERGVEILNAIQKDIYDRPYHEESQEL